VIGEYGNRLRQATNHEITKSLNHPMNRSRRLLSLVVLLLLIAVMLPSRWAHAVSRGPREIVVAALRPADLLRDIGDSARGHEPADIARPADRDLEALYGQALRINENLRTRLDTANQQIAQLSGIRQMFPAEPMELVAAGVLTSGAVGDAASLVIDKGRRDGVREGQTVTCGIHLIGRVTDASPNRATVRPITIPGTHLAVKIKPALPQVDRAPAPVLIKAADGAKFVAEVDVSNGVAVGDLAHLYQQRGWPNEAQGFVVGQVTEVLKDEKNPLLRRIVTIEPYQKSAQVRDVVVLVPFAADDTPPR
jgi:hypothetical protein